MQVEVQDMPTDAKSLHQAVKAALVAAALRLEGIQRGPLLELQESATFWPDGVCHPVTAGRATDRRLQRDAGKLVFAYATAALSQGLVL